METQPQTQPSPANLHGVPGQLVRLATPNETAALAFPESGYVGVAAKFAERYSRNYESPKEFFYIDLLALIGTLISGRVRVDVAIEAQPRLYVLKIAPSAWQRKSTSTRIAEKFLRSALQGLNPAQIDLNDESILSGVGSAEGLGTILEPTALTETRRVTLVFDEFRRFESKARIEGSVLRPVVNELYESNRYANRIKSADTSINVIDGHLGFLSNTTVENYLNQLNIEEAQGIGFLNRFFLVVSTSHRRIPLPEAVPEKELEPIRRELESRFAALPALTPFGRGTQEVLIPLTSEARKIWSAWYTNLEEDATTARLDTIGLRLMGLLAFTSGKNEIDVELLGSVLDILEYEHQVRTIYRPNEGSNPVAKMEENIRRALARGGPLSDRNLRRQTNADRNGLAIYRQATTSLKNADQIAWDSREKKYRLIEDK